LFTWSIRANHRFSITWVFGFIFGFLLLPRQKRLREYLTNHKQNKNKYENLIFVQNRFQRRRRFRNFEKISLHRRRLFLIGGDDSEIFKIFAISATTTVFFEKIGGDGGSADRLTPPHVTILS
jgi:hypothetical protein